MVGYIRTHFKLTGSPLLGSFPRTKIDSSREIAEERQTIWGREKSEGPNRNLAEIPFKNVHREPPSIQAATTLDTLKAHGGFGMVYRVYQITDSHRPGWWAPETG